MTNTRVAVWGTGVLGGAMVRLVQLRNDLELVGAYTYTPDKSGKDVGEIIKSGELGVTATNDVDTLRSWAPQVILHSPMDLSGWTALDELTGLLEAGFNVITALPYRALQLRDQDVFKRLKAAAEAGGSTFYCTGVNPDFVCERMVLTLTGICGAVDSIHVTEVFRGDTVGPLMYEVAGYGRPIGSNPNAALATEVAGRYFDPSMRVVAEAMGVELDEIVCENLSTAAPDDIDLGWTNIPKGTLAVMQFRWEARSRGRAFYTVDAIYHIGHGTRPPQAVADECWIIDIEGTPSVHLTMDSVASLRDGGTDRYADDPTPPGMYATGAPLVQAIAKVVAAPPGVLENVLPFMHHRADSVRDSSSAPG